MPTNPFVHSLHVSSSASGSNCPWGTAELKPVALSGLSVSGIHGILILPKIIEAASKAGKGKGHF
jgi:hypothetical protein